MAEMALQILFWVAAAAAWYAYVGYPLLLFGISRVRRRTVDAAAITPPVSFIITAHNEERGIAAKIENTLRLEYPRDRLEILVASDCSTDRTDEIVGAYAAQGVTLVRVPERKGKEHAQKYAVARARGVILVFSDVATILAPNGVAAIVRSFHDPTVGCVSSVDRFVDSDGKLRGEGAYVWYEMLLRDLETRVNSLVGLSGSFFAARREICERWAPDLPSDFNTVMIAVALGFRAVSDRESLGFYRNIAQESQEFNRKVRTVLRGMAAFMHNLELLNVRRYGLFSWQIASHKLARWAVPAWLVVAFTTSALLAPASRFYLGAFLLQAAFYALGILGAAVKAAGRSSFCRIPAYFLVVNLAILSAWFRYARGERRVIWSPSRR